MSKKINVYLPIIPNQDPRRKNEETLEAGSMPFIIIGSIQGVGMGLFFVPLAAWLLQHFPNHMPQKRQVFLVFCQNLGTSISISLLGTLLRRENQINWNSLHIAILVLFV